MEPSILTIISYQVNHITPCPQSLLFDSIAKKLLLIHSRVVHVHFVCLYMIMNLVLKKQPDLLSDVSQDTFTERQVQLLMQSASYTQFTQVIAYPHVYTYTNLSLKLLILILQNKNNCVWLFYLAHEIIIIFWGFSHWDPTLAFFILCCKKVPFFQIRLGSQMQET